MRAPWWCLDCDQKVELDRHGRCATCCSEAVVMMERSGKQAKPGAAPLASRTEPPKFAQAV